PGINHIPRRGVRGHGLLRLAFVSRAPERIAFQRTWQIQQKPRAGSQRRDAFTSSPAETRRWFTTTFPTYWRRATANYGNGSARGFSSRRRNTTETMTGCSEREKACAD